jgi:ribosomal protein S27E
LAAQYGEKEKTVRKKATTKTPRKRRDAAARARLQEVIAPDDALLARLARAGAISSSLAPDNAGDKTFNTVKKRRSRYWETRCGKCGKSGRYRASAALCVGCGAILVRE